MQCVICLVAALHFMATCPSLTSPCHRDWPGICSRHPWCKPLTGCTTSCLTVITGCRFVVQYCVGLPDQKGREDILKVILERHCREAGGEQVSRGLLQASAQAP